jgi:hypothetical protein
MRIPDEVKRCVIFIGIHLGGGKERYAGTGFMLGIESEAEPGSRYQYIVTARHVVEQLHGLDIFFQGLKLDGATVKLDGDPDLPWVYHPDDDVDVAVLPISAMGSYKEFTLVPYSMLLTSDMKEHVAIGIGDEVFVPGLFTRLRTSGEPIVRVGNLAMKPIGKVIVGQIRPNKYVPMEAVLIDQRSLGGMSGSPVFVRETAEQHGLPWRDGKQRILHAGGSYFLLGLMHGHWKVDPTDLDAADPDKGDFPIGMSIVVPAQKIADALNQPALKGEREAHEVELRNSQLQKNPAAPTAFVPTAQLSQPPRIEPIGLPDAAGKAKP